MQLLLIVALCGAVVAGHNTANEPPASSALAWASLLLGMAAVWLSARYITWRFVGALRSNRNDAGAWLKRLDRWQRGHVLLWLATCLATLFLSGWPQLVRADIARRAWPLVDDVLLLLPVVLPLLFSWAEFYRLDCVLAERKPTWFGSQGAVAYVWQHVRQQLAVPLVPLLLLLGVEDVVRTYYPALLADDRAWVWCLPLLLLLMVGFPLLLRRIWHTEALPSGELRTALKQAASKRGIRPREIYLWHTGGRTVNAAVSGVFPALRYVFLSDGLLASFTPDQVEAVLAHEIGHLRAHHLLWRMLAIVAPALWLIALGRMVTEFNLPAAAIPSMVSADAGQVSAIASGKMISTASFFNDSLSADSWLLPLGLLIYVATVFGRYSRQMELEADIYACSDCLPSEAHARVEVTPQATEAYLSALAQLARTGDVAPHTRTWLHPSLHQRAAFILQLLQNPVAQHTFAAAMRRRRRLVAIGLAIGVLVNIYLTW